MPINEAIAILSQTCSAMDEAHRLGVLHRDLKPENIWLEPAGPNGATSRFSISASPACRTFSRWMTLNRRPNSASRRSPAPAVFDHGRRDIAIELHGPANEPLRFRDGNAEVHVA